MSRRLRAILPSPPASLQPVLVNPEDIQLRFEEKQDKQKTVYDRNARTRAGISVGDQILMRVNSEDTQLCFEQKQEKQKLERSKRNRSWREARETEHVLRQNSCQYLSRRPDTDEKELPCEPQLPVIRRPAIPTVLPPNQPAEVRTCGGRFRSAIRSEQSPVEVEIWTVI